MQIVSYLAYQAVLAAAPRRLGAARRQGLRRYRSWLESRELIQDPSPLFAAELAELFAEADFILALRSASATSSEVYSEGFTRASVLRFHARLADARAHDRFSELFGVRSSELNETLGDAYIRLRANQHS